MITRKDWKAYKKEKKIPDGVCDKVSVGDVLETYEKSKQTSKDLDKLEKAINQYHAAAKKAGYDKAGSFLSNAVNTEIAERQEAAARTPQTKEELSEQEAKRYRGLANTLTKHHANILGVRKALDAHPEWFARTVDDEAKTKRDKLLTALQSELDKMFAWCSDPRSNNLGDTLDISLNYKSNLRDVSAKKHADLITLLDECLKGVKEMADRFTDKL